MYHGYHTILIVSSIHPSINSLIHPHLTYHNNKIKINSPPNRSSSFKQYRISRDQTKSPHPYPKIVFFFQISISRHDAHFLQMSNNNNNKSNNNSPNHVHVHIRNHIYIHMHNTISRYISHNMSYEDMNKKQHGAAEARRAHNPEDPGSKPGAANFSFLIFFY